MTCLILFLTTLLVMWSLYEMSSSFLKHRISQWPAISLECLPSKSRFAAYNSTEITREHISLIFELREICLSLQLVFSLASAAVVCVVLDNTSVLKP